jgi:hypothetical protein
MPSRWHARLRNWAPLEDRLAPALTFRLDYTFDDPARGGSGFFQDPARKAELERAATDLTRRITSTPTAITPGGTNTWSASFFHPTTGALTTIPNLSVAAGEMVIYVGARPMGSSQAAVAGPGGYQASGSQTFFNTLRTRGLTGFATWGGSLSFDSTTTWYTGSATSFSQSVVDLYTVATHELGHVLGFGTSAAFTQYVSGTTFIGPNAMAANGNQAVTITGDDSHWTPGTTSGGKPASMQSQVVNGVRYGFSELDYAALKDMGWQVSAGQTSPPRNASSVGLATSPVTPTAFQAYTLTATITRTGGGTPTGNVTFTVDGLTVGTVPLSGGKASISVPGTGAGTYSVVANYTGDSTTLSANGTGSVTVQSAPTGGTPLGANQLVLLAGPSGTSQLYRFTATGGLTVASPTFQPFDDFKGAIRSTVADVNGDGTADFVFVVGSGGGSRVRIINGKTGADLVSTFSVFESTYHGGLFVAAGDFDGDGRADVAVSPDRGGGGRVTVLSYSNGKMNSSANFFGIEDSRFRGGARLAVGDVDGDGRPDLIVGAGFGGGPRVAIFDGQDIIGSTTTPRRLVDDFFAFGGPDVNTLRNGIFISAGDINGDGKADLVFGGGPGGGPRILIASGATLLQNAETAMTKPLANFFAFADSLRGGVRPAVKDADGDGKFDLVLGSGEADKARVKVYRGSNLSTPVVEVDVFNSQILAEGIYVG